MLAVASENTHRMNVILIFKYSVKGAEDQILQLHINIFYRDIILPMKCAIEMNNVQ